MDGGTTAPRRIKGNNMDHRVKYMIDLIEDCKQAMGAHTTEQAFEHPQDRARIIAALVVADSFNGLRKAMVEGR
jgi:hypothetical protein